MKGENAFADEVTQELSGVTTESVLRKNEHLVVDFFYCAFFDILFMCHSIVHPLFNISACFP